MLRIVRNQRTLKHLVQRRLVVQGVVLGSRFLSTNSPDEIFTKLSDKTDPNRSKFFQYTWGSWLKDDLKKKERRETKFSIEGVTKLVGELNLARPDSKNLDKNGVPVIKAPVQSNDGTFVLNHNLTEDVIGPSPSNKDDKLLIKSIASIHEGKHHRIYKITLSTGKELILRIPYRLETMAAIAQKIKSEVATLDFLDLKLGAKVPKVVAYGIDKLNFAQSPFILMEHIEGDSLMKQWDPLLEDSPESEAKLKEVIEPISAFQEKLLSVTFNKYGSLYFLDDVTGSQQNDLPYDGETNPLLKNRWRIGSSVEKPFSKYKNLLSDKIVNQLNGPWTEPLEVIKAVATIELENVNNRLALAQADASSEVEDVSLLKRQQNTFQDFKKLAAILFNPKSESIVNVEEVFKPRLFAPDLDPLNVIVKNSEYYFLDFEHTTIKPFIFSTYPAFVGYDGAKVYNLEEDIPDFATLEDLEQQQYQFMYYKTRNERLWELALNEKRHDLIAIALPFIKSLKSPYVQALELKNDKDYLYVEGTMVQLQSMWELFVNNNICNSTDKEYPIKYTPQYLEEHKVELQGYQHEISSKPFAATGGWVPQDMFDALKEQGIIVETSEGDYKIDTERALEEDQDEIIPEADLETASKK